MLSWLKGNGRWLAPAALVLLNLVLITLLLLQHPTTMAVPARVVPSTGPSDLRSDPSESETPSESATPSESVNPRKSASPSPSAPRSPAAPHRLLAANSAKIAWRAEEGGCRHQSAVEVTTDGGRTWRKTKPGIRGIVRLRAYGESSVFAVGADAECKPTYAWISSPDGAWRRDQSVIWDVWFRYPSDPDRVHAPGGRTSRPCGSDLVSFAASSGAGAAALCGDGRIRASETGTTWRTLRRDSIGITLGADERGLLASLPSPSCDHETVHRFDANGIGLPRPKTQCTPSQDAVAIARSSGKIWRWEGDDTVVS